MRNARGFTIVELIVVISVITILSSMLFLGMRESGAASRDADRKADLLMLQNAIELYKNKNGMYPLGCNGANNWSAEAATPASPYRCASGSTQYITDLAPEFIPVLPKDQKPNGDNSGYHYFVNTQRTSYKLIAYRTVESEVVDVEHDFRSCDPEGYCSPIYAFGGTRPSQCDPGHPTDFIMFETSYGLWGGYPAEPFTTGVRSEEQLELVVCRMP